MDEYWQNLICIWITAETFFHVGSYSQFCFHIMVKKNICIVEYILTMEISAS